MGGVGGGLGLVSWVMDKRRGGVLVSQLMNKGGRGGAG